MDGFVISDDRARLDVDRVHRWLSQQAYWALGRPIDVLRKAIDSSLCFGVYRDRVAGDGPVGEQVAFARVVTDGATFAWVCDVFVEESVRGLGVGTWMMRAVVDQLEAQGILRLVLATRDAHQVYERVGFAALANPRTWLERDMRPQRPEPGSIG